MSNDYPLYPQLTEEAEKQATARLNSFVDQIKKVIDKVLSDFYVEDLPYIESDTWTNFRNEIFDGYKNYSNRKIQAEYDFKQIRQQIYKEYREELIIDLNQDMVGEIEELKTHIGFLEKMRRG